MTVSARPVYTNAGTGALEPRSWRSMIGLPGFTESFGGCNAATVAAREGVKLSQ